MLAGQISFYLIRLDIIPVDVSTLLGGSFVSFQKMAVSLEGLDLVFRNA